MSQHPCDVNKRVNCEHKEFILWLTTPHLGHMLEAELEKELFCHFGVMFSSCSALKKIGQSWDFVPTGLTPLPPTLPLPERKK